jgi:SAM-dependent methyltransferase
MSEQINQIRSAPSPECVLCGSQGLPLHTDLRDRLFGATGEWKLVKCPNRDCELVWPDPMPLPEEIWKAYANYYTHKPAASGMIGSLPKRIYRQAKRNWLSASYGYRSDPLVASAGYLKIAHYLLPMVRPLAFKDVRLLKFVVGGKLLDVGCGSGEWMAMMRCLGWNVEGVDFDEKTVQLAREKGLNVHIGSMEDQHFVSGSFDAITLNHVIEHVPDPISTIAECARLLKPGGRLVMFTPNASSFSHRLFGQDWRGLEPPRHLHIFSFSAMRSLLRQGGFAQFLVLPDVGTSVSYESYVLRKTRLGFRHTQRRNMFVRLILSLLSVLQSAAAPIVPNVAECLAVVAVKK